MRVAAVACLMSSGLLVAGVSAAVALAEPDGGGDATSPGTPGRTSGESAGAPGRSGPRDAVAGTEAESGPPGRRPATSSAGTALAPAPSGLPKSVDIVDDSKLPEADVPGKEAQPGDPVGEEVKDGDVKDEDEDEDECGWWWPLPPNGETSTPGRGDGYDGAAPSGAEPTGRPGVPPGMNIPPPQDALPESPVLPDVAEVQEPAAPVPVLSIPVFALPPTVPGLGGADAGPRTPAGAGATRPPAPPRGRPAERATTPRTADNVLPASYRAGYREYLRTADTPQLVAVAVPGATGIMLLTGVGGLIGYRQARAGHAIRAGAAGRFTS